MDTPERPQKRVAYDITVEREWKKGWRRKWRWQVKKYYVTHTPGHYDHEEIDVDSGHEAYLRRALSNATFAINRMVSE